ncbi:ABC transporter ATP-binding protein [Acidihalobacter ferrooxydans]|uniref:ABC transporter ATP-binding protein n=1 Tax=Acidihalobacter ferrooxydans TaxID=1765967 RepID=A0A1P8UI78_9GAMM|nr:ABC transporter ATP-binding protein/permease [Acidihalobacter ferrooxydans]APZ43529.1 ABC transporter ATP-binding protein [Acidihalobacter ferrooxydans]
MEHYRTDAGVSANQRFNRAFFRDVWRLAKPYFAESGERWQARALLAGVILTTVGQVYISLRITNWYNSFYNALQTYDSAGFWRLMGVFAVLASIYIVLSVYQSYLTQLLDLRWRRWLTGTFLSRYLSARTYYHMEVFKRGQDNPDQRIADDLSSFAQLTSSLFSGMLSAIANLVAFIGLLWVLSAKVIVPWGGVEHHIPGFLVWVALLYAVAWTWVAARVGNPLIHLNYHQQRLQADFRFSLMRLRENSEAVALYGGEAKERANFDRRFDHVFGNYKRLILRQKRFNWFSSYFSQVAIILPFLAAASAYFAKAVPLGFLMQISSAFGNVQGAFAYIAQSYDSFANWHAVVDRLRGFLGIIEAVETLQLDASQVERHTGSRLKVAALDVRLPGGQVVVSGLNLEVGPGERLLVTGPSGTGKSTLMRVLAGIWPFGKGRIELPDSGKSLFLPQKPYLPMGSLRNALLYPSGSPATPDTRLFDVLDAVGLAHLIAQLGDVEPWSQMLSLGEQQRVAIARVLLQQPRYVFLDEATSALDEPSERALYLMLTELLPQTAMISVGHRSTLIAFHQRRLHLSGGGRWEELPLTHVPPDTGGSGVTAPAPDAPLI